MVMGKRQNVEVEVDKNKAVLKGDGPYRFL